VRNLLGIFTVFCGEKSSLFNIQQKEGEDLR